jgi:transglutaminase/protease-like cytokinesis protein 3
MMVFNEEPQLFWMGSTVKIDAGVMTVSFKTKDKSEISTMQSKIDAAVSTVMAKVNAASGTFEKLKVMYDYVVLNNNFSLSAEGYNASIYNAFTSNGDLQCGGYAKAIQYLCDLSGIESTVVVGTNEENESHAWNIVYCGDGYYNLDATWGDPINNYDETYIRYTFFLVPDSWIHNSSHFNINKFFKSDGTAIKCFDVPSCTKTTYNYFNYTGNAYSDYTSADAALKSAIDDAIANKKNAVEIRVTSDELFEQLTGGKSPATYQKYAKGKSSSVKGISKHTADMYKKIGVVYYDIIYN